MSYIEKESLIDILNSKADMALGTPKAVFLSVAKMVDLLPPADVVPVVRCRDCKHFTKGMAIGMCKRIEDKPILPIRFDHFCSYGERNEK